MPSQKILDELVIIKVICHLLLLIIILLNRGDSV